MNINYRLKYPGYMKRPVNDYQDCFGLFRPIHNEIIKNDVDNPLYKLFDFNCQLASVTDISPEWLQSFKGIKANPSTSFSFKELSENSININNSCNSKDLPKNNIENTCNSKENSINNITSNQKEIQESFLDKQEAYDFMVIVSKLDANDINNKNLLYFRSKCNITEGTY